MKKLIYTIGHSTRSLDELLEIFADYGITKLIDIRTVPKSRFNPQFNKDNLEKFLPGKKIAYEHHSNLGGWRKRNKASINTGWRNQSFRSYADYMQTAQFALALKSLEKEAQVEKVVIMCAETLPWRCHRFLVADALTVDHFVVKHILTLKKDYLHRLNSLAKVKGREITYPENNTQLDKD